MDRNEVTKLVTYIEENLRASPISGLPFVDARLHRTRLVSRQNHVVFGRRGAGKTSLLSSTSQQDTHVDIYLNLESYKDITFPNIVIHMLAALFSALLQEVEEAFPWFWHFGARKIKRQIARTIEELNQSLHEPDAELRQISTTEGVHRGVEAAPSIGGITAKGTTSRNRTSEVKREISRSKIDYLRLQLTTYMKLLSSISALFSNKPIFLIMDDYYFVSKTTQPELVDYFHRLTKGTALYIKLATIKYRSKLYRRTAEQYVGVELGHDIFEIDMDYTLDNFVELQAFMRELLERAIEQSKARISVDEMFAGDGFSQLCLASGGVPRDFLSLFVTLANQAVSSNQPIGKVQVTGAAIANVASKFASMQQDSGDDDDVLLNCLYAIKRYVYDERRTNAFLVAKADLDKYPEGRQATRELVDLRLIHLVDGNISKAPSDGRRYEAYIIDLGLYDNSRPRNFNQIEPGQRDEKSRKDDLRASPVFELAWLQEPSTVPVRFHRPKPGGTEPLKTATQLTLELSFE